MRRLFWIRYGMRFVDLKYAECVCVLGFICNR